jgi:putative ABC transport system permease protein
MSFGEAVREALRTLRLQWLRAALTLFGIVWGTAAVVFLVAWGLGVRQLMEDAYGRVGHNLVVAWPGIVGEDFTPATDRRKLWFTRDDVEALRASVRRADLVTGSARRWSVAAHGPRSQSVNLRGVEPDEMGMRGLKLAAGRPIATDDVRHRRRVAVVCDIVRQKLLGPHGGVGSRIRIEGRSFRIIGLASRVGTQLFQDGPTALDEEIWIPITTLFGFGLRYGADGDVVDAIDFRLRDRRDYDALRREIRAALAPRLGVKASDEEAIVLASPLEALGKLPLDQMDGLLLTLSVATLVIGGIGVLTMMLDAVHDRRQEIGVRLAVGARRRDVLLQFLLETAIIAGIGGAAGLALGLGGCAALARLQVPDLVPVPIVRADVVGTAVAVLAAVSLGAGIWPAWRAARTEPSLTLRAE